VTRIVPRIGSGLFALSSLFWLLGCSSNGAKGEPKPGSGGIAGASGNGPSSPGAGTSSGGAANGGAANGGSGNTENSGGATTDGTGGNVTTGGVGPTGSGGGNPASDGGTDDGGTVDCATGIDGIEVAEVDLDAFPAYAIDGCTLVYVSTAGELKRKNLVSGAEMLLAAAAEMPRRPTVGGAVIAWEATENGKSVVRVRVNGSTTTIAGNFDHAGEPKATVDAVVFTGFLSTADDGDTDVFVWQEAGPSVGLALGGAGQQRFADISPSYVAVSDFSEDPSGRYAGNGISLADVVLIDRTTGTVVRRQLPGKQAFPMLGARESLLYLEWTEVHPVPKLQDYTIRAVPIVTPNAAAREIAHVQSLDAVRPTASGAHVEWVSRESGTSNLFQAALDGSATVIPVALPGIAVAHAPVSTARFTVLAVRPTQTSVPRLDLIAW
jgi:hypothetical protein